MNKKKLSTAIIIPLAIILLATTVWAAVATVVTPTDAIDSTVCAEFVDQNLHITGTGWATDKNLHFFIDGFDVNNHRPFNNCGIAAIDNNGCFYISATTGTAYFDGNVQTSNTGTFTIDINFARSNNVNSFAIGQHDVNVRDANALANGTNFVDTTFYLKPKFKQSEFLITSNGTISVCKSTSAVNNLKIDANNNYLMFTQSVALTTRGTIDFDSNIAVTGKAIQVDARSGKLNMLANKTANIHFDDLTAQTLYEGEIDLYWTPPGITSAQLCPGSQCTDITYGNQKADFKVLNFSGDDTYELVVAGGKPHGKLIQLPPSGIPGLSIVGDAFGNKYVVSVFVIIALFGVFIVGSRLLKRR